MASYKDRMKRYREVIEGKADLAFIPIGTDLDYLAGIHRDIPNFGRNLHPGMWLEGAWITPEPRADVGAAPHDGRIRSAGGIEGQDVRVLGDWDDPATMVRGILKAFGIKAGARIATSDNAEAESAHGSPAARPGGDLRLCHAYPARDALMKSPEEIETMSEAGRMTEAAFAEVLKKLKFGMTELDVIAEVDFQMKRQGSLGATFTTSLYNSGPNHPLLMGKRLRAGSGCSSRRCRCCSTSAHRTRACATTSAGP